MPPADWPVWTQIIAGSGIVAAALLTISAAAVKTGRGMSVAAGWVRSIVVDAMTEVVRDHAPSVEQVTEIVEAKVAPLHAELRLNGGRSLKDQATRIEAAQEDLKRRLDAHLAWSQEEAARVLARLEQTEKDARAEQDERDTP